jgi:Raf kinase inhibitor-like YbhB/YbcL family protein
MRRAAAGLVLLAVAGCGGGSDEAPAEEAMTLASAAFEDGGTLPKRFTCDGPGVSPPLRWSGVPGDAQDLVLVVEDRDVPVGAFVHWTVWKLPFQPDGAGRVLEDGVAPEMNQGRNDLGDRGWGPPCPPKGDAPHHYEFTLHALSQVAEVPPGAPVGGLRAAIAATGLAEARLDATYGR